MKIERMSEGGYVGRGTYEYSHNLAGAIMKKCKVPLLRHPLADSHPVCLILAVRPIAMPISVNPKGRRA